MPEDDSPTADDLIRTGLRRRRLARMADAAAEHEADPVRAAEHRRMAQNLRFGAKLAFGKALRGMTFKAPVN